MRNSTSGHFDDELFIRLNAKESWHFLKRLTSKPRKPNEHMLAVLRNYRCLCQEKPNIQTERN